MRASDNRQSTKHRIMDYRPTTNELTETIEPLLASGRRVNMVVTGRSMLPFLRHETDSVTLLRLPSYRRFDIVLVRDNAGRCVMHRIISIDDENVVLMGDGNLHMRERCRQTDILGVAISRRRYRKKGDSYTIGNLRGRGARFKARLWWWLRPLRPLLIKLFTSGK